MRRIPANERLDRGSVAVVAGTSADAVGELRVRILFGVAEFEVLAEDAG
jgi:hypothetical protein